MNKKTSVLLAASCIVGGVAAGQSITVGGKVTDSSGAALEGVTIAVAGQANKRTMSRAGGNFSIEVATNQRNITLVFTSTGYKESRISTGPTNNLVVTLRTDVAELEDFVAIGYQTVKRKDLMASVASVDAKQLKDVPINSAAEILNGRLAGVTATTSEGSPDANISIRVRGGMSITQDNTPLYIVDGVQVENALNVIAPQDIATVDVLKDAAATSIYGARGANGVIIVTTKSGRPGKIRVNYNTFVGVRTLARKLEVLNPYEFLVFNYERSLNSAADSVTFRNNYGRFDTLKNYQNVNTIDWQEEMLGNTGVAQTHSLGFTGGSKKVVYNFNYTYNHDKPIVLASSFRRHLLNGKVDFRFTPKARLVLGGRYTDQRVIGAGVSDDRSSSYNRLRNAVRYRPFLSAGQDLDDNDPFNPDNVGNGLSLLNPFLLVASEYRLKTTQAANLNATFTYNIAKNLVFRSVVGYDRNERIDRQFSDSLSPYSRIQGAARPIVNLDTVQTQILTQNNTLTYSLKKLAKVHDITVILGEETYDLRSYTKGRTLENFPNFTASDKAFGEPGLGTLKGSPRKFNSRYTSLSFFGRVNYGYAGRYFAEFNLRADGSSKFASNERWGYFPSASLAWVISQEKFLRESKALKNLKLRLGYGQVGNNRIDDYLYLTTFRNDQFFYSLNGQLVQGFSSVALSNQGLRWESLVNQNLGLDMNLFGRMDLSADYYVNNSKDLLLNVPIASTFGYQTQLQNIGRTTNKGFELQISAQVFRPTQKNFSWTSNFNISTNKNTVTALGQGMAAFFPAPSWGVSGQPTDYIVRIGDPVGAMYGLVTDGFYKVEDFDFNAATQAYTLKTGVVTNTSIIGAPQPGSIRFKDLNGDGRVDLDNDRTIIGNPQPKFTGGFTNSFTYGRWDASLFVNFSVGNDVYNANKIEFTNAYTPNANALKMVEERWRTIDANGNRVTDPAALAALNANATMWRPIVGAGAFFPHSWAIEDGSFLRFNNVTLGYTFSPKIINRLRLKALRLYATANNLAVITNYSGFDPEVSVRNNPVTQGLDYSAYPKSRSYVFGLNVSL